MFYFTCNHGLNLKVALQLVQQSLSTGSCLIDGQQAFFILHVRLQQPV